MPLTPEQAEEWYVRQTLSMRQISKRLQRHIDAVRRDLVRLGFAIRTQTQEPNPFHYDPAGQEGLEGLGIGLWLGEGTKKGRRVELANTDPRILKTWIAFLVKVCQVDESKLRLIVDLPWPHAQETATVFWETNLGLPLPYGFVYRGPHCGKGRHPMGVARVRYNSKFLQQRLQQRAVELTVTLM